jgi:hypothetical protein
VGNFAKPWPDAQGQQAVFQIPVPTHGKPIAAPGYRLLEHWVTLRPFPTNTKAVFAIVGYGATNRLGAQVIEIDPGSVPTEIYLPSGNLSELQIDSLVDKEGVIALIGVRGGGGGRIGIPPQSPTGNLIPIKTLSSIAPVSGGGGGGGGGGGSPSGGDSPGGGTIDGTGLGRG